MCHIRSTAIRQLRSLGVWVSGLGFHRGPCGGREREDEPSPRGGEGGDADFDAEGGRAAPGVWGLGFRGQGVGCRV